MTRKYNAKRSTGRVGLRSAATVADKVTRRVFGRNGFARAELLTNWPAIVGDALARHTIPEKLHYPRGKGSGGTLWIRADGALGLELQHLEPVIISKINTQCGYRAVDKLRIVQGPVPARVMRPPRPRPALEPEGASSLAAQLETTDDPELRAALERLGRGVYSRNR